MLLSHCLRSVAATISVVGVVGLLAMPSAAVGQAGGFFDAVPGTEMVDTGEYGKLPREVIMTRDGAHMVLIPAGTYKIGRPRTSETLRVEQQTPEATVTLGWYYIDKYEINVGQYTKSGMTMPRIGGLKALVENPSNPVVGIDFEAARGYATWAGRELPTEAEWEVAGRGAQGYLYPWGNEPKPGAAHVGKGGQSLTKPVDQLGEDLSPFGVVGMGGNVSEWTIEYYHRNYYTKANHQTNPLMPTTDTRTVRGGNYYLDSGGELTLRTPYASVQHTDDIGFRTVFRLRPAPTPTPTPTPTPAPLRRTSLADQLTKVREVYAPYFAKPDQLLPRDLSSPYVTAAAISVANMSPYTVVVGVYDSTEELMAGEKLDVVEAATTTPVSIPKGKQVHLVARAGAAPFTEIVNLGEVHSDSNPLVILRPEMFRPMLQPDDTTTEPMLDNPAEQIYEASWSPLWDEFVVVNETTRAVRVAPRWTSLPADKESPLGERVLEAGQAARFKGEGGRDILLAVDYVGARGASVAKPLEFKNDASQDARCFVLREDTRPDQTVRVVTAAAPMIRIEPFHFRLLDTFRRVYLAPELSGKKGK